MNMVGLFVNNFLLSLQQIILAEPTHNTLRTNTDIDTGHITQLFSM